MAENREPSLIRLGMLHAQWPSVIPPHRRQEGTVRCVG